MQIAYLNEKFVPLHKAKVSILDRGFLYGDGVFETMRAYDGSVFLLEKHVERLFRSLKALRIEPGISKPEIRKIIYKLLAKNKLKSAYIKLIVTRGETQFPPRAGQPGAGIGRRATVVVYALPYKPPPEVSHKPMPETARKRGVKVLVSETRFNEKSNIAGYKTLNYLFNILCRNKAIIKGYNDAILINTDGFISEATSSNIFLVKGKKIYTPSLKSGILPGVTRLEVIRLAAKRLKSKVTEGLIKPNALYKADEVFFTNSLTGIMPVVRVGRTRVGDGKEGPLTRELTRCFNDAVNSYINSV